MDFFTSDPHWGHANIIKYCNRPFKDTEEMDAFLIKAWNDKVGPEDSVYIVGDMTMHNFNHADKILKQLNGDKYLVKGNHDKGVEKVPAVSRHFKWIKDYYEYPISKKQRIVLSHYAFRVWNQQYRGAWHLYGHSHGGLPELKNFSMDVGVDSAPGYAPYSLDELREVFKDHSINPEDKH